MRSLLLASTFSGRRRRSLDGSGLTVRGWHAKVHVMRGVHHALSRRVGCAVAALSLAVALAACSDSEPDAATTTASTAPTTSAASTAPERTTSTSSSTSAPPSTSTSPPSTTLNPAEQTVVNVRVAIDLAQETFSACLVTMPSCDPGTLAVARAGGLLERNTARINEWNAAGYTVRNRDQFRYVIESVTVAPSGAEATALVCIADDSDLVLPGAGPGGADVIIDDSFTSGRALWDMRLDPDGRWRAHDAPAEGPTESSDVCPAA